MYKRKIAIMTLIGIMTLLSGCSAKEEEQFTKTMLSVEQKTEESIQIVEEDDSYSGQKLAFGDYLILLEKAEIGEKTKGFRLTYSISGKEKSQGEIEEFARKIGPINVAVYMPEISKDDEGTRLVISGYYSSDDYEDIFELQYGLDEKIGKCSPVKVIMLDEKELSAKEDSGSVKVVISPFVVLIETEDGTNTSYDISMEMSDGTKQILAELPFELEEINEVTDLDIRQVTETDNGYAILLWSDIEIKRITGISLETKF